MVDDCVHRQNCRLCGSRNIEMVIKLKPIPLSEGYTENLQEAKNAARYPLDVYMCIDCGHVQQMDVVNPEILWASYTYASGQAKGIPEHMRETAEAIIGKVKPDLGALVVDVGSNDGSLLKCFKQTGFNVVGIDPSKGMADRANASGIRTFNEFMSLELAKKIRSEYGPAQIVCAFNVFAHADNLDEMTESVRELLSDNGLFFFEAQYLSDIIDNTLVATIFHEHMSHHSIKPLSAFFDKHGLELISVEKAPIQHGSIIGAVQLKSGNRKVETSVQTFIMNEDERKLDNLQTMLDFGTKVNALCDRTMKYVAGLKNTNKKICAYGAARSAPTLLTQFGLETAIDCIYDDHPQKVGKLSSGYGIPIHPTKEIENIKPDFIIILAWVHADKIIANNQKYIDDGGSFIVLCPRARVVSKAGEILI